MKKQFLILTFLIAAVFAGMKSYGQYQTVPTAAPQCLTPKPLDPSCSVIDELHPAPGIVYTYTVTSSAATNDIRWFVINNNDLKTASPADSIINSIGSILPTTSSYIDPANGSGAYILNLGSTNNTYNQAPVSGDATGTDHSIQIAWKSFNGLSPNEVLLVASVTDDAGCTDNIAVYRILPEFNFTLDIAALGVAGDSIAAPGTTNASDCVSPIEFATYLSANDGPTHPTGTLTVDYGENWMFFIVNAANFVDSWMPDFEITYTGGVGDPLEASWAYLADATNAAATWNAIDVAAGTTAVPVIAGGATNSLGDGVASAVGGECIVVRVRIDHGTTNENTDAAGESLTFAVNGVMYDNAGTGIGDLYDDNTNYEDLHHTNCTIDGLTNDRLTYELTPRPEIDEVTPTPFETKTGDE